MPNAHMTNKKDFEKMLESGEPLAVVPIPVGRWQDYSYGAKGKKRRVMKAEVLQYPVNWREKASWDEEREFGPMHRDGVRCKVYYDFIRQDETEPGTEELVIQRKWFRGPWAPHEEQKVADAQRWARQDARNAYYKLLGETVGIEVSYHDLEDDAVRCDVPVDRLLEIAQGINVPSRVIMSLEKWMLAFDKSGSTPKSVVMY